MKQIPIKLGPVALLLTVISICLTVMTILTFSTAGADLSMSQRYADSVQIRCELEKQGQEFLKDANEAAAGGGEISQLPDTKTENGVTEKKISRDGYELTIRLQQTGERFEVTEWKLNRHWEEKETIDGLWQGL